MAMQLGRVAIRRICVNKSPLPKSSMGARSFSSGRMYLFPVGEVGVGEVIAVGVLAGWSAYWFDWDDWRTMHKTQADALYRRKLKSIKAELEAKQRAVVEEKGSTGCECEAGSRLIED